ncbi:MAG: hypothetical protein QM696_03725 [Steroidobacteraceae bacterium]
MSTLPRSQVRGQALAEYLIVCAALTAALFLPYAEGHSVAALLASALVEYLRGLSFVTSIL